MSDRIKGIIVTLENDIREDDAKEIINAVLMIKGVLNVTTSVRDHNDIMNRERVRSEYRERLWNALNDVDPQA